MSSSITRAPPPPPTTTVTTRRRLTTHARRFRIVFFPSRSVLDAVEESLTQHRRVDDVGVQTTRTRVAPLHPTTTTATTALTMGNQSSSSDALKQQLVERDARLSVLRSRLDMVERENENLKRERGTSGASASASGGGGGGASRGLYGGGGGGGSGAGSMVHAPVGNAANAVAKAEVQELKQEVNKLRSMLAFKEEEMLEARRAEDDSRAKLREADAERTMLAAEVRAERRARATAGQKRATSATEDGADADAKRRKTSANGAPRGGLGALNARMTSNDTGGNDMHSGGDGTTPASASRLPGTLPLSLPTAPPDVAATLYQRASHGGRHHNDSIFARLMHEVPLDVSAFLAKPSDSSAVSVDLVDPVRASLTKLATNPDSTATLTRALIETIERTAGCITSVAHYKHVASVFRILSALTMIDARSMSIVLGAFGAQRRKNVASVTAHGAPPPALAGIPGLGGMGMGTLVAHPRAQSDRIFVPAPMSSSNHVASKNGKHASVKKSAEAPAALLETFTQLLSDAKNDAQWYVVDAILVALIRFANGVGVESGRGAFGAVAQKGSGFGSCLKPIAPSRTRFLALMLTRVLAPTPEFQSMISLPLDLEPAAMEKPYAPDRKDSMTLFVGVLSCLRADCVDENTTPFSIKPSFLAPLTPAQAGTLQEAALRVLATLAYVGWSGWKSAAYDAHALDVLAAVAVEEYVSPLPLAHCTATNGSTNAAVSNATMLVFALLNDDYAAQFARLGKRAKSQRVVARLAHLSSAVGSTREARLGDWLTRILLRLRD